MSIDMYVSKSKAQATSTSQVCQQHLEGYEALQQAISQFTLEPFLKGKAYDSAKAYYSTVLYPLVQGGILLTEATEAAVKKFPERYQSEVDSGDLKQSELEEQIRRVNELIHQANDLENQVRQSPLSETDQRMQLQFNQALLEAYQTSKQELEEKLQKLIAFHASSPSIFSEIASLKQAIDQGLAQTKTAWNPTSGTFMIPSQEKLAWANTIRAFQQKKEAQEEPDTTGRTYTRIDLGNGTYIWAWSKDGRTLTQDDIQFTVKHDKWAGKDGGLGKMLAQAEAMKAEAKDFDPVKAIKEIADLFTPLGDGVRVMTGEDPITGDKLSWGERGLSLLFIIPPIKIGKYGAKGFKFIAEGVEDLNKINKKADKVKEVEKSTKKASGADDIIKDGSHIKDEKLKPNSKYKTGEFDYLYETDEFGRIKGWNADDLKLTEREDRLPHNPNTPGKLSDDHAGHLAADRFGGSPELDNLVSQLSGVNLSAYKKLENQWAKAIKEGKSVSVKVKIDYDGSGVRPISFDVEYVIDGKWYSKHIENT